MIVDFVKHIKSNKGKVSLSILLVVSILSLTTLFVMVQNNKAEAAAIRNSSDTLNNSAPNATSNHSIVFTSPTGVAAGQTIIITFPSGFSTTSGFTFADMDLSGATNGEQTLAAVASGASWGATTTGDVTITFTSGTATLPASEVVTIEIGDNAAAGGTGDSYLTNPTKSAATGTADIITISVSGSFTDSGDILVAIIEGVTVSVTVDESLTFSIAAQTAAQCADYDNAAGTEVTTTSSTVPFAQPALDTFIDACQSVSVSTNASSGYVVTVEEDDQLRTGAAVEIPDGTCDGACTHISETDWTTAATNNGFGYCMEDTAGDGASTADTGGGTNGCDDADTFFKLFAANSESEVAQNILRSTSTASGDSADIGYRLSIPGDQAAGTYTNTLTFVATPTF